MPAVCTVLQLQVGVVQHVHHMQMTIEALEDHHLLDHVMRNLDSFGDIARCSAVSRAWRSISQNVQLTYIAVNTEDRCLTPADDAIILQHVRLCEARGMFRQLQRMYLVLGEYSASFAQQCFATSFFVSLVAFMTSASRPPNIIGTWPLRSCHLAGKFPLMPAVLCLPKTVQILILEPDHSTCPGCVYLHVFSKFAQLQRLEICAKGSPDGRDCTSFVLDGVLESLQTLYLLDKGVLQVSDGYRVTSCLPALQHIGVAVSSFNARALLALPGLKIAALRVTNAKWMQFTPAPYSSLRILLLDSHATVVDTDDVRIGAIGDCILSCPFKLYCQQFHCNSHGRTGALTSQ